MTQIRSAFLAFLAFLAFAVTLLAAGISGQAFATDEDDVVAIADQALARISAEDSAGLAGLMIEEAMFYVGVVENGEYSVRTQTYDDTRNRSIEADLLERGWDPTVLVSGTIAVVWYPYDIYVNGEWSHCGIDIFNMIRTNDGWRIAVLQYNIQQPPDCAAHPDGPPPL